VPGYVCVGIKKDSEDYYTAKRLLAESGIGVELLADNELIDGYVRLLLTKQDSIDELFYDMVGEGNTTIRVPLNNTQKETIKAIFELYSTEVTAISAVKNNFSEMLKTHPSINKAISWWDSIKTPISLTSIGRVIGHTYAKSIDPSLPT
jgi:hypothetical protein